MDSCTKRLIFTVAIVLTLLASVTGLLIKHTTKQSCSVLTDKGEIDLSSVAKTDGATAAFQSDPQGLGAPFFMWNPCMDITPTVYDGCSSGQLFQISDNSNSGECSVLADKEAATFTALGEHIRLDYTSNNQDNHILLICPNKEKFENDPNHFVLDNTCDDGQCFNLTDPACCFKSVPPPSPTKAPNSGLSTGSILLIVVLVLAMTYLIAGIVVMKFAKGAQGSELVPNVKFWKTLPFYVKRHSIFIYRMEFYSCSEDAKPVEMAERLMKIYDTIFS